MARSKAARRSVALTRFVPRAPALRSAPPSVVVVRTGGGTARRAGRKVAHVARGMFTKPRVMRAIGLSTGSSAGKAIAGTLVSGPGMPAPLAAAIVAGGGYLLGGQGGTLGAFGDGMLATQGGDVVDAIVGWISAKVKSS